MSMLTEEPDNPLFTGWTIDQFLDRLPIMAGIVGSGERLIGASDGQIQAWAWGIEDTQKNLERLIVKWRSLQAND